MFREKSGIYYTDGHGGNHITSVRRPPKSREKTEELRRQIFLAKLSLRNPKNLTEEQRNVKMAELQRLERELEETKHPVVHKIRKSYKKLSPAKIKEFVLMKIAEAKNTGSNFITAEDIAHQLNVKTHFVKRVLQELNVEGILHQPEHHIPHDSNRDPWCSGKGYSGWLADIYKIRNIDEEDTD